MLKFTMQNSYPGRLHTMLHSLRQTVMQRACILSLISTSFAFAEEAIVYPPVLPQPQASEQHWLLPLLSSAKVPAEQQPNVVRATHELRRSELARYQVMARWNPELTLGGDLSENRRISTSSVDGFGVVVDQGTGANAAISNTLSTGTTVRLQAATQQTQTSSASALRPEFWNSTVQLVMSQALLQGANYHVNRTDLYNALDQHDTNRDTRDELLENQLLSLCEIWLDQAQREIELALRQQHLTLTSKYLRFAEERARLGLGRELDAFSLRRDMASDEAQIGIAQRALAAIQETLRVSWPNYALPDTKALRTVLLPAAIAEKSFAQTRNGRTNLRRIQTSSRQVTLAKWNALDRLDLTGSFGKNGTDVTLDRSWSELSNPDTYRWAVGLNYVHRFGEDSERLEYQRALIALDQSKLQGESDERTWRTQSLSLRQALTDAQARVGELQRVYLAYREEYRLTKAQADAGLLAMRDLISIDNQLSATLNQVVQSHLDTLRAEVRLRAHEDRLLELLVP
jgi:outer membrane protein TolC